MIRVGIPPLKDGAADFLSNLFAAMVPWVIIAVLFLIAVIWVECMVSEDSPPVRSPTTATKPAAAEHPAPVRKQEIPAPTKRNPYEDPQYFQAEEDWNKTPAGK